MLCLLVSLLWVSGDGPGSTPTGEPERSYRRLAVLLADAEAARSRGESVDPSVLSDGLDSLIRAVSAAAMTRVDVRGPAIEVTARAEALFGEVPRLPVGEESRLLVLESAARSLFVYGLALEASRAVRIDRVVVRFTEGPALVRELTGGEGVLAAGKRSPLVGSDREPARVLEGIEVTGRTRLGSEPATLDLIFSIPDPGARPYREAGVALADLRVRWSNLPADARGLSSRARDLERLAPLLGLVTEP